MAYSSGGVAYSRWSTSSFNLVLCSSQPNHLVGLKGKYLVLRFHTVEDLMKAKRSIYGAYISVYRFQVLWYLCMHACI